MKAKIVLCLVLALCIQYAAAGYSAAASSPICDAAKFTGAAPNPTATESLAGSITNFDQVSYYYDDASKDHVQIVTDNSQAGKIGLTGMKSDFTSLGRRTISYTGTLDFVILRNQVLIVKQGTVVKAYFYTQSGASPTLTPITLTIGGGAINKLTVFEIESSVPNTITIYARVVDTATPILSGFYTFPIMTGTKTLGGVGNSPTLAGTQAMGDTIAGSNNLYLRSDGKCYIGDSSTMTLTPSCDTTISGKHVETFNLMNKFTAIYVNELNLKGAGVVLFTFRGAYSATTADHQMGFTTSLIDYRTVTDQIRNLLVMGDANIIWFTVKTSDPNTLMRTNYSPAPPGTKLPTDLTAAMGITIAGNRAFFIQPSQIFIIQHDASDTITYLSAIVLTTATGDLTSLSVEKEYKYTLKCKSTAIKLARFSCFATTLNCLTTVKNVGVDGTILGTVV